MRGLIHFHPGPSGGPSPVHPVRPDGSETEVELQDRRAPSGPRPASAHVFAHADQATPLTTPIDPDKHVLRRLAMFAHGSPPCVGGGTSPQLASRYAEAGAFEPGSNAGNTRTADDGPPDRPGRFVGAKGWGTFDRKPIVMDPSLIASPAHPSRRTARP
jgi:hypothetical protein